MDRSERVAILVRTRTEPGAVPVGARRPMFDPASAPPSVSTLLNLRVCESPSGKMVSVLELPGSVLVVPQATLGGKVKGRAMQYHGNVGKEDGLRLYHAFVDLCEKEVQGKDGAEGVTVRHGTYGHRQVLSLDTNGPHTHTLDF